MGLFILISNIYVHFFKKEEVDTNEYNAIGLIETLKKLKFFVKNKNLMWLIIFLMTR